MRGTGAWRDSVPRITCRDAAVAGLCAVAILAVVYVSTRLHATYRLQTELAILKTEHRALMEDFNTELRGINARLRYVEHDRLDQIETLLYGEIRANLKNQAPNRLDVWQENVLAAIRGQLSRIERRLIVLEREHPRESPVEKH